MLRVAQERGTEHWHDYAVDKSERSAAVGLGDQSEHPAGFEDSQNLSHVGRQGGPVIVRLHGRDEVERAIREWQCGNSTLLYLDSPGLDVVGICVSRDGDAGR